MAGSDLDSIAAWLAERGFGGTGDSDTATPAPGVSPARGPATSPTVATSPFPPVVDVDTDVSLPPLCDVAAPELGAADAPLAPAPGAPGPALPPVSVGRYRLSRVLGSGGMAIVVLARDTTTGRDVSIKLLRPERQVKDRLVKRFLREAHNVARLRSPYVRRVYESGVLDDSTTYIVMEYLDGVDLGQYVNDRGLPTAATAIDWILQACAGLAEAHALDIVHRDIKPSNLFLCNPATPDAPPLVKVIDFGISKAVGFDSCLTRTREVVGTPAYMAPEQLRSSRAADARADIWALGVLLAELLTGRRMFVAKNLRVLCRMILDGADPVFPDHVSPELARTVRRCLASAPEDRYPDAAALAAALAPHAADPARASALVAAAHVAPGAIPVAVDEATTEVTRAPV